MNTITRSLAAAAALALLSVTASPASTAEIEHQRFVDSGAEAFTDCPGINAEVSWNDRVHVVLRTGSQDGFVYFAVHVRGTSVFTNLDTGGTYTNVYQFNDKDLSIVDNGDGTLTITVASRGSFKWFDSDGNRVLKGAGLFRFQFMVEHSGTPTDPEDDVFIEGSFLELKNAGIDQTAERDFCADFAEFTT